MLEIGTIVYLKQGSQKLMILNRGAIIETEGSKVMYDYSACVYPLGFLQEQTIYFNEENIDKVIFNGFHDEEEERFMEIYKQCLDETGTEIEKGIIKKPMQ